MDQSFFPQPICKQIWNQKYQFQTDREGYISDVVVTDTWSRIAKSTARNTVQQTEFYDALAGFKWLPAGRIQAGAGTGRTVTLFNCFVMGTVPDSLAGIYDMLKEAALTMQQGGGIGYDFSTIRPKGSTVKGVEAAASGPLTFMDVWDASCRTIMSAGSRRGAMMATLRCDHPDILEFIEAKHDPDRLRNFNMSVLVTDDMMLAMENDEEIELVHTAPPAKNNGYGKDAGGKYVHGYISARILWDKIMRNTYEMAEPGVIFIDRINNANNLYFAEKIAATNPCGEQPLPPYGACLLGSLNLAMFVTNPFTPEASLDQEAMEKHIRTAVHMLDNVIDRSGFPLEAQRQEALHKRRMGIGITGLASALFMLGIPYGAEGAVKLTEVIMQKLAIAAYEESIALAKEFGPCPAVSSLSDRTKFCQSEIMRSMPKHIQDGVMQYGIRNTHLMSIAPTGTISLYAGNVSSGIEPIFAPAYDRKVTRDNGVKETERVMDYAVNRYLNEYRYTEEDSWWKDCMVTAQTITPEQHVQMQAAAQKWVDSSISKTVNVPEDISFDDFQKVYLEAYQTGCKGCTTYRPNDITGSVLSVETKDEPKEEVVELPQETSPFIMDRPTEVDGKSYKLRWQGQAVYVTFNHVPGPDGWWVPFEMFVTTKSPEHQAWIAALTRMVSAVFRRGGDIRFVVEELKNVFDPKGGQYDKGVYCPSLVALLGKTLESYLMTIGYQSTPEDGSVPKVQLALDMENHPVATDEESQETISVKGTPNQCPQCLDYSVVVISGCPTCQSCGHSKCG